MHWCWRAARTHKPCRETSPPPRCAASSVSASHLRSLLNGQPARLAPGARIRGLNNLLVMSGALAGQRAVVNYTLDPLGLVLDVWILTDAERKKQPWPTNAKDAKAWSFDPIAQVWTKP